MILKLQGQMGMALQYLAMVPSDSSGPTGVLRYRIFYSGSPEIPPETPEPEYPFQEPGYQEQGYQEQGYQDHSYQEAAAPSQQPGSARSNGKYSQSFHLSLMPVFT